MYKIDDMNGEVSVVVYLEDENEKEFSSCWYFEIFELEGMLEIEFEDKLTNEELYELIKKHAIHQAEVIMSNHSVNSMEMNVYNEDGELVDYRDLDLSWKNVSQTEFGVTYINYNSIEYSEVTE